MELQVTRASTTGGQAGSFWIDIPAEGDGISGSSSRHPMQDIVDFINAHARPRMERV
jgi:hypothetical protein